MSIHKADEAKLRMLKQCCAIPSALVMLPALPNGVPKHRDN
jgi:hypothetical protein